MKTKQKAESKHANRSLPYASKIEPRPTDALIPNERNPRTHSRRQIEQVARSIDRFGFVNPIIIDQENRILAGVGRWQASKHLGFRDVPTIVLNHLTAEEKRAYVITDNKLAQLAGWDREILAIELQELTELKFDIELTGFSIAEIDLLLEEATEAKSDHGPEDEIPEIADQSAVSRPGDLWILGTHRLLCADARDQSSYATLLGEERADAVFADPPYNVPIGGHVSGKGRIKHREFAMASGEFTRTEFVNFLKATLGAAATLSRDGAVHFVCMDWRHISELQEAGCGIYGALLNLCVWAKTNGGMGSLYRSQHELVFVYRVGSDRHLNNVELGQHGRNRSNVWTYAGVNTFRDGRFEELAAHPTVKPVALVADAIRDVTRRGEIVLDPFVGSGTTLIAAEKAGRLGRGIEIDPLYADVAVRRWQTYTGKQALHAESGRTFEDVELDVEQLMRSRKRRQ
ncbi:MAG: ParB N-terminal domain-containing protein [Bradyrhizobiaceae bacterium]|nr:ParB N-terminal domain-containing protein [Bradyrhizobiaceae bacterium]